MAEKWKYPKKSETEYSDIRIVEIFGTTLGIIYAKFHKSRFTIVAVKWKYPEKSGIGYPDIRIVKIFGTTLVIIHAKFHKSSINIVAVKWKYPKVSEKIRKYPKKSEIGYPDSVNLRYPPWDH